MHTKMLAGLWRAYHLLNSLDVRKEHEVEIKELERLIMEAENYVEVGNG